MHTKSKNNETCFSISIPNKNDLFEELLNLHQKQKLTHLGSVLSCFDLLYDLFFFEIKEHDYFILSKGHGVSLLYLLLYYKGYLSQSELATIGRNGSIMGGHPPLDPQFNNRFLTFGTGALGYGLSLASGIALAKKYQDKIKNHEQIFILVSEGDLNSGVSWEAFNFISIHNLNNITILFDHNGYQATAPVDNILNLKALESYIKNLGFYFWKGNGHIASHFPWKNKDLLPQKPKFYWFETQKNYRLSDKLDPLSAHYASS